MLRLNQRGPLKTTLNADHSCLHVLGDTVSHFGSSHWLKPFWLKPFWLKPFCSSSKSLLFSDTEFCRDNGPHSLFSMGRGGWTSADASGWVQIIRGPRPPSVQWPRVWQQFRQPAQQSQPQDHRPVQKVKTSGTRPFVDPKRQGGGGEGTRAELGVCVGRHGRNGRSGGRFVACSPQTSTRGREGSSRRRPDQRVRGILRKSCVPSGGIGHQTSHLMPEHRVVEEAVGRIEGSVSGNCTSRQRRRGGSATVERWCPSCRHR